jgi:hypothetical protein
MPSRFELGGRATSLRTVPAAPLGVRAAELFIDDLDPHVTRIAARGPGVIAANVKPEALARPKLRVPDTR